VADAPRALGAQAGTGSQNSVAPFAEGHRILVCLLFSISPFGIKPDNAILLTRFDRTAIPYMKCLSTKNVVTIKPRVLILDEDNDVLAVLSGVFKLKNYEVFKANTSEQCMEILGQEQGRFDALIMNGKVAEDRGAMVIVNTKKMNVNIRSLVIADADDAKTRILDYGADEFALRPMSTENVADKVFNLIATLKKVRNQ
jgi:CheY-like chemotaxis protein